MKGFHYVYTVVNSWRKLLDNFYTLNKSKSDDTDLYRVFNRDFTNSFLTGDIDKNMFIDNPRDNSALYFSEKNGCTTDEGIKKTKTELHELRTEIISNVRNKISELNVEKSPLKISFSGKAGLPLSVSITTANTSFVVCSKTALVPARAGADSSTNNKTSFEGLNYEDLHQQLESINETEHVIQKMDLDNLQSGLFLPLQELTAIKKRILSRLNGSKEKFASIETPLLKKLKKAKIEPTLSVLISSSQQLAECLKTTADLYFQLPSCFNADYSELIDLFLKNKALTPWFPSVLIGKDYTSALDILHQVNPKRIITNNTGIAYEAYKMGIPWIAGPYLNSVNSFSLLCLKENFNCSGSFISNEISKDQIKKIITPEDFNLYYSIYHPVLLLTSRQCLFHQIDGCNKSTIDEECNLQCNRFSSITNLKNRSLLVNKTKGYYHRIYNNINLLNTDIVTDLPDMFSSFFIDLTDVKTETNISMDNIDIIKIFENLLKGSPDSKIELEKIIHPSSNIQYKKGI